MRFFLLVKPKCFLLSLSSSFTSLHFLILEKFRLYLLYIYFFYMGPWRNWLRANLPVRLRWISNCSDSSSTREMLYTLIAYHLSLYNEDAWSDFWINMLEVHWPRLGFYYLSAFGNLNSTLVWVNYWKGMEKPIQEMGMAMKINPKTKGRMKPETTCPFTILEEMRKLIPSLNNCEYKSGQ